jgi:hypothetical protein
MKANKMGRTQQLISKEALQNLFNDCLTPAEQTLVAATFNTSPAGLFEKDLLEVNNAIMIFLRSGGV